jgi:hypothetical protein
MRRYVAKDNCMSVEEVLQSKLCIRESSIEECQVWEHKTFNTHRGVLHLRFTESQSLFQMSETVTQRVSELFRVSWWRGFGFGAVLESPNIPEDVATIDSYIHTRAKSKATWQWIILTCPTAETAIGVHTWVEGYLTPVFRRLLDHYESLGYQVGSFKKEKDQLMQFLTTAASLRGFRFKEFNSKGNG